MAKDFIKYESSGLDANYLGNFRSFYSSKKDQQYIKDLPKKNEEKEMLTSLEKN
jgi:hypothetical protein